MVTGQTCSVAKGGVEIGELWCEGGGVVADVCVRCVGGKVLGRGWRGFVLLAEEMEGFEDGTGVRGRSRFIPDIGISDVGRKARPT